MEKESTPPPAQNVPVKPAQKGINVVDRAKNILITPKTEWAVIEKETYSNNIILTSYVLPMLLIGAVATFIGQGLIGVDNGLGGNTANLTGGLVGMLLFVASSIILVYGIAAAIDVLGPSFGAEKNWVRSFQLSAYSLSAAFIGSLFFIFPALWILVLLCALYSLYPLYTGLTILKKTPADKQIAYFAVTLIVTVLLFILLGILEREIIKALQPRPRFLVPNFNY
jgi:hypothetical protein